MKIIITSAVHLSVEEKSELFDKIDLKETENIEYRVDKSLLAGYIIEAGSKMINLSLKGKLDNFKEIII